MIPMKVYRHSDLRSETDAESTAADLLLLHLTANGVKQTRIVEVGYTGPDPTLDRQVVNTLIDDFIDDSIRSRCEASARSARFLPGLRSKVDPRRNLSNMSASTI